MNRRKSHKKRSRNPGKEGVFSILRIGGTSNRRGDPIPAVIGAQVAAQPANIPEATQPQREQLVAIQTGTLTSAPVEAVSSALAQALARVATNAWRAKLKLVDGDTGEPHEETKRIYRHIEGIMDSLKDIGIETLDLAGRAYDSGMPLKVICFEQTPGLSKEEITETIKPAITWQGQLIQMSEVIVGTP